MARVGGAARRQESLDAILALADEIARLAPDCADRAMRIAEFARDLGSEPDAATVEDAIVAETADSDLSDTQVRTTARSVVDAMRKDVEV